MKIGIIGGGMMGLTAAYYLSKTGLSVTVFEKENEIGGLSSFEEIMPGLIWDRFYHVILSNDNHLIDFIGEIGLSDDILFSETKTGFYTDGQLHSMSSVLEFLRFKPISFWNKLRLGAGILYSSKVNNYKRLERLYAKFWLIKIFGRRNYEKLWDPLLRSKLGSAKSQASASFIWAIIRRYYGTRQKSSKKELMGCVRGGYYSILKAIQDNLAKQGVTILNNKRIDKISTSSNEKIRLHCDAGSTFDFDRVIATIPNPKIVSLWPEIPADFKEKIETVDYLSLICMTLVLNKTLSPFYVTNLTDPGFPFTGVIETSNVMPSDILRGRGLIYLPRYMVHDDPFRHKSNEEIAANFIGALKRIFPELQDDDLLGWRIHREAFVQPIHKVYYSNYIPSMQTPLKNFYMVNTTMILNSTLNNNQVIQLAKRAANFIVNNDRE